LSFDRRSFIGSALLGMNAFRRKIVFFDFSQQATAPIVPKDNS
jgi:hypothetical protein